jgi:3-hydroxymyristoyl/3-hydroxydecanoyl-(acyl carrier protein) dehydratase
VSPAAGTVGFRIPEDHPACDGHFPGFPVVPGAVLLDEILSRLESALAIDLCSYRLSAAKFPAPLAPGTAVSLDYRRDERGALQFSLASDGRAVATGILVPR